MHGIVNYNQKANPTITNGTKETKETKETQETKGNKQHKEETIKRKGNPRRVIRETLKKEREQDMEDIEVTHDSMDQTVA